MRPGIVIRARSLTESDVELQLPWPAIVHGDHVAWEEGEPLDGYEKNTGGSAAEAVGSLLIELTYRNGLPLLINDIILEDNE
jgi:hypothetical protein